jgi:hypothetical protein
MARQALPALTVATFIPLALFYAALTFGSVKWAIGLSVLYAWLMAGVQYGRQRRVSGMLMVTWLMANFRAVLAFVTGHTFLYFALPVAETAGFGLMFVLTLSGTEPLVVRLARDLVPSAADGLAERRTLVRALSAVWAVAYVASALVTMLLLVTTPLSVFYATHVLAGWVFTTSAGVVSVLLVRSRARGLFAQVLARAGHRPGPVPELAAI